MEHQCDFVEMLTKDMSIKIFTYLDEPAELTRLCAVSKKWYRFVIENQLCKQFCVNSFLGASKIMDVVEVTERVSISNDTLGLPRSLVREHKVFSFLACFSKLYEVFCNIQNPREHDIESDVWKKQCGKRESDPTILETGIYKPVHSLCLISEIAVLSFRDDAEDPSYSAKAVRFSFGYQKSLPEAERASRSLTTHGFDDDLFVWTYCSPEFPMAELTKQSSIAYQKYRLPKPVLCIGRIVKMELLGGVRKSNLGGLHIRASDVRQLGPILIPMLDINIVDDAGSCRLTYALDEAHGERMQDLKTCLRVCSASPTMVFTRFLRRITNNNSA